VRIDSKDMARGEAINGLRRMYFLFSGMSFTFGPKSLAVVISFGSNAPDMMIRRSFSEINPPHCRS
jgi:hypothetical protein